MAFDGLFTRAMTQELTDALTGGRINRIYQPYNNEIVMIIRAQGENYKLLLSAHPSYARLQLTDESANNPPEPPMFCMLLRKHLERAIIDDIRQAGLDRMVIFEIRGRDELGDESYKQLIIEVMGRHSNIILVDKEKNTIIDSIKHVPAFQNSYRTVLPGSPYVHPPAQNKSNPFEANEDTILRKIDFNSGKMDRQIVEHFSGISPLFAKEITFRTGLVNRTTLPKTFIHLLDMLKKHQYEPTITVSGHNESFYLIPLQHKGKEYKHFSTLSEMLDHFYFGKAERDRVRQQANDLERFIKNEISKNTTKIKRLQDTLRKAERVDEYQLHGELLTANMYLVKKGMSEITVANYYDPEETPVTIKLDPRKSPAENAQRYFSQYDKAKTALVVVKKQIKQAEDEIVYFETLLQQINSASTSDIEEIRDELMEEGYIKKKQKAASRKKTAKKPVLEKYESSDQTTILVGKNNRQNDYLTNKLARRDEIWLHTKDIPGSHVVIRSENPTEQTILEAAMLAAYFSKAKDSSSVPVDYTKVRHVKKPSGAKPGFVIYEQQQTVFVTPDEDLVKKMRKE